MTVFSAAVLTGGASRRMGRDKALLEVGGVPLAVRVAGVLHAAGAAEVMAIGGDLDALRARGLDARADPRQGQGPLAGLLSALDEARHDVVVVVACDLPDLEPGVVESLVAGLGTADVACARTDRRQPLCVVWRRDRARPVLAGAYDVGERAIHRAWRDLVVVEVPVDASLLRDVDEPGDLEGGTSGADE